MGRMDGVTAEDTGGRRAAPLPLDRIEAFVFDVDGVVTDTARVHQAAWKRLFDEYLRARSARLGEPFRPFEEADYLRDVDGIPRYDGVAGFLASRGVDLPRGEPDDPPDRETVCGLGNRKNGYFLQELAKDGAPPFPSTVAFLRALRAREVPAAAVSSSRNAAAVLDAAGVRSLFDAQVDGVEAARLGLAGKPDPALFIEAARRLGVAPERAAVVEDALAGVEAGHRGGFGLVVGVDRVGQAAALAEHGADVVVGDLAELHLDDLPDPQALASDAWTLAYEGFDPATEGLREALCTLGNGYFATRGAAPEARADGVHYPGTYVAGCYNRLVTEMAGRAVENEDLVNVPNWLPLTFQAVGGDWFEPGAADLPDYRQELDLRRGVLARHLRVRDREGRVTRVTQRRLVHMGDPHLAGLETTFVAENWSGRLGVRSALDGRVTNAGVARYRELNGRHLVPVDAGQDGDETIWLQVETTASGVRIAQAARTRVLGGGRLLATERRTLVEPGFAAQDLTLEVEQGVPVMVEKIVALFTSRDRAITDGALDARQRVARAGGFAELLERHALAWDQLWRRCRLAIDAGDETARILNLHVFHLLQTISEHSVELDVGVPARGWHGEAYRGHVFWDELFILPFLNLRFPELARALLRYRWRRLPEARWAAREAGYAGAMYPWQSGSNGREETQRLHLNPRSGRWLPDHSHLQRHVNVAVAYNVWHYYQATGDLGFLSEHGAEMLLEIARFWASSATFDDALGRYRVLGVMGPDEYHDAYPDADRPGLDDNAYTNVMAVWVLHRALDVLEVLPGHRRVELEERLALQPEEIRRWRDVTRRMRVAFHDGDIISQFDGYDRLEELDWDSLRRRHGDIRRLDRILEAEGDSPNRYKASKQADVLMLFYLLSADELRELLGGLGYPLEAAAIRRNVDYYLARTSHGSTLSSVVHAWVLARSDRSRSWRFFTEALASDLHDVQDGTTAEGIHLGAMAGTVDLAQRCYTGIEIRGDVLWLNPSLPEELSGLDADLRYRGHWGVNLHVLLDRARVRVRPSAGAPIKVSFGDEVVEIPPGDAREFAL
ncbi:MAG TPA: beta-phosphoglucomutase family hydrolase [Actinomycetes bacterium]|nr:beta-phosphoglucomutase family hydrolase [Actinomycetes bacterium]